MRKILGVSIFFLIIFSVFTGLSLRHSNLLSGNPEYLVRRVIDGDTIEVETLGKIRYIGIDTPETKHPTKGPEPYGWEAFEANRRLVEGKKVRLELDVSQRDRYGRILAYVYVGDTFVNAWLVANGYAHTMTVPPNVKYAELFVKLEREAREAARGLWGKTEDQQVKPGEGYWSSSKQNKFHKPNCRWARQISPTNLVIYQTREEAVAAGCLPCKECQP